MFLQALVARRGQVLRTPVKAFTLTLFVLAGGRADAEQRARASSAPQTILVGFLPPISSQARVLGDSYAHKETAVRATVKIEWSDYIF